jgi:hypothetical protein
MFYTALRMRKRVNFDQSNTGKKFFMLTNSDIKKQLRLLFANKLTGQKINPIKTVADEKGCSSSLNLRQAAQPYA